MPNSGSSLVSTRDIACLSPCSMWEVELILFSAFFAHPAPLPFCGPGFLYFFNHFLKGRISSFFDVLLRLFQFPMLDSVSP